jgi:hypothetical protein
VPGVSGRACWVAARLLARSGTVTCRRPGRPARHLVRPVACGPPVRGRREGRNQPMYIGLGTIVIIVIIVLVILLLRRGL